MRYRALLLLLFIFPALTADSAVILFQRTQEAEDTPFEPLRNPGFGGDPSPITSDEVQSAIEEVYQEAPGKLARYGVIAGYQGSTDGQYLEFFRDITSNDVPFIFAEDSEIKALSMACEKYNDNGNVEVRIRINGAIQYTFILVFPNLTGAVSGLTIPVSAGDELSIQARNNNGARGDCDNPIFTTFVQVINP